MPRFALRPRAALPLVLVGAAALLAGCNADTVAPAAPDRALKGAPGSIVIVPDVFCPLAAPCGTVTAGDSIHFIAYQFAADGTPEPVKGASWDVSDSSVATVSRSGWIRGRKTGDVVLSASKGRASADTLLSVQAARLESVRLSAAATTIPVGGTVPLSAVLVDVLGEEHPAESISWFVHNPTLASVNEEGVVEGLSDGQVIVSGFGPDNIGGWIALQVGAGAPRATGLELSAVTVGAHHSCGVTPGGEAYCWGWNFFGQLGQGFFSGEEETFGTPLPVPAKTGFRAVSGGSFHTCALDGDGRAWCWGANMNGQGGTGTIGDANPSPVPVAGDVTYRTISAGGDHTCALRSDGIPVCWGASYFGQLGNGTTEAAGAPAELAGGVALASVRAGLWHSCGLTAGGTAYCWGDNSMGQVGNGKAVDGTFRTAPTVVRTPVHFTSLETSAASSHTCGLTSDGEAWCWGRNDSGQLGDGTREHQARPVRVRTSLRFSAIMPGGHHTCALTADGTAHCWGNNFDGQLGDRTLIDRITPAAVLTSRRFVFLAATNNTTCGRTSAEGTHCWGANEFAQLGAGFTGQGTLSAAPIPVVRP